MSANALLRYVQIFQDHLPFCYFCAAAGYCRWRSHALVSFFIAKFFMLKTRAI